MSDVLWKAIYGDVDSSTPHGRVISCEIAAARLDELGLLTREPWEHT